MLWRHGIVSSNELNDFRKGNQMCVCWCQLIYAAKLDKEISYYIFNIYINDFVLDIRNLNFRVNIHLYLWYSGILFAIINVCISIKFYTA